MKLKSASVNDGAEFNYPLESIDSVPLRSHLMWKLTVYSGKIIAAGAQIIQLTPDVKLAKWNFK